MAQQYSKYKIDKWPGKHSNAPRIFGNVHYDDDADDARI